MKKKNIIIILVVVLLYGFIMFMLFYNKNNDNSDDDKIYYKNDSSKYLVIGNTGNFMFKNNKWIRVGVNSISGNNLYKIYDDNNYLGEYKLQYGTNWNIFNEKNEYVDYNGNLFAYSNNFDIKLIRFNSVKITDDDKKIVKDKYGNKNYDYIINSEVVNIDLDNNGQIDKIICLSNNDMDIGESENYYNLLFIILNGNYYTIIDQNKNNSKVLELPVYKISRLFIYENEYYIVVEENYGIDSDSPSIKNYLYKFNNDKFINVLNN